VLLSSSCITEPPLKVRGEILPPDLGDGLAVASPAAVGFDEDALAQAVDAFYSDTAFRNAVSLLVVRNRTLVLEAYARSAADRDVKRHTQSVTKSVTSLVFGIARDDGYFQDLDQVLFDILPQDFDAEPAKRSITLRHLLTMRSGIGFDNDDFSREMLMDRPRNQARYILAKPLVATPGSLFSYRDADPQLISSAFEAVTGRSLEDVARERLFAEMGIEDFYWERNVDGTPLGAHALFLRPRDLAKLGLLVLEGGTWNGTRLVSERWIQESTSIQTATDDSELGYGYYWWVVPELDAYSAWGHGGQFIFVVPAEDLVICMTSLPSVDDEAVGTTLPRFLPLVRLVLGSIR
jgi:CubicO group peptidase (beta-lactamase class C family)